MNFSFWPFLWFGFAGATPDVIEGTAHLGPLLGARLRAQVSAFFFFYCEYALGPAKT